MLFHFCFFVEGTRLLICISNIRIISWASFTPNCADQFLFPAAENKICMHAKHNHQMNSTFISMHIFKMCLKMYLSDKSVKDSNMFYTTNMILISAAALWRAAVDFGYFLIWINGSFVSLSVKYELEMSPVFCGNTERQGGISQRRIWVFIHYIFILKTSPGFAK